MTPDALLELPDLPEGNAYELSDGEVIIVDKAGLLHELIKTTLSEILMEYRLRMKSGRIFVETQFTLGQSRARIPDLAWVSRERLNQISLQRRSMPIAPDIAIEIISDSEQPDKIERKLRDYLDAGVEVWQVFPSTETVVIWRQNQGLRLAGDQKITSEHLPGFSVPVTQVFIQVL